MKTPTPSVKPHPGYLAASLLAALLAGSNAYAVTYTYNTTSGAATENWSAGTGWNTAPASSASGTLTFIGANSTNFTSGATVVSNNDLGVFQLNQLNLQGSSPVGSGTASLAITGGTLQFVNNGATGPTVNLNALSLSATTSVLVYNIGSAINLINDTTFAGNGSGTFNFTGAFTGSGALTKTGNSTLSVTGTTNFAYSGNINLQGGTLTTGSGMFLTSGGLTTSSGATLNLGWGTMAVSSLSGAAGMITGSSGAKLYVNYVGTTTGSYGGSVSANTTIFSAATGNLSFGSLSASTVGLTNLGTGTITAQGVGGSVSLWNPYATIKLTGTVAGSALANLYAGNLLISPSGSNGAVVVTGQTTANSSGGGFRYGTLTLKLDKGSNTSVEYRTGGGETGSNPALVRNNIGALIIDPVYGASTLGSTAKFTVLKNTSTAALPVISNGIASSSIVVVNNDANKTADFVTYVGTGVAGDTGFTQTTYGLTDTFAGSSSTTVVKNTIAQTLSSNTSAFALRNDSTITLNTGVTLTLGNYGAADSTHARTAGLILNGGTITGGTLAMASGTSELTVYTSVANGTIGSKIIGAGDNSFPSGQTVSLTKFGAGTLYLTNVNSYTGATAILGGALDVGTISSGALPSTGQLILNGGVLQGNGAFTRSVAKSANTSTVTWDNTNIQGAGGGFAARGGALVVNLGGGGATLTWQGQVSGTNTNGFLRDGNTFIFGSNTSDSQVDFQNAIDLGTSDTGVYYRTIYVNKGTGTDSALMSGAISSTSMHGIIKDGDGKLILSGANTYTGDTVVSAGILQIGNGGSSGTLGTGAVTDNASLVFNRTDAPTVANAISGTGSVTQAGTGTVTFTGANTYSGATNVQSGILAFGSLAFGTAAQSLGSGSTVNLGVANTSSGTLQYTGGTAILDKNIIALGNGLNTVKNSGGGLLTLAGSLVKDGTILVLDGGASGIKVTGTISGSKANSDLYVTGGTTTLTAQNTYNGPTWVYDGGVLVNGNASGALPNTTTLILGGADNSNGAFDLNGNNQTVAGLSSQGAGTANIVTNNGVNSAALVINGTGGTFAGSIQNGASATSLTVQSGNQILNGTNTYTGNTTVLGGTLGINGSLGNSAVSVQNGAALVGSGTANGNVTVNGGSVHGTGLNLGATTFMGSSSLSGVTTATSYTIASGSTSLSGTAKGAVSVSAGAILGNSGVIKGNTTVSGLLEGTGTIDGSLSLTSGVLAPGNSTGITTITGNFAMDNQSTLTLGISGTTGAGIDYDQVRVAGAVSLAGTLNLTTLSGLTKAGESITLILNTSNTALTIDGTFSSIEVDGVTQTVTNNTFSVGNMEYQISYNVNGDATGIANDVVLTVVPEPATWALIAGGVGMLTFGQRIRRRLI